MKVCIIGASGKLGQYMVQHCLDRGYEVVGVCRRKSVGKIDRFKDRITSLHGSTDDREVVKKAALGCWVLGSGRWYGGNLSITDRALSRHSINCQNGRL